MKHAIMLISTMLFASLTTLQPSAEITCPEVGNKVGNLAPDFELRDENNTPRKLSEFRGKFVVLTFYPRDFTSGCDAEACSIRDTQTIASRSDVVILGVNYQAPEKHKEFKAEKHLPHILLSDEAKDVAKLYGAYRGFLFPSFLGPKRRTFIIDKEGIVLHLIKDVDTSNHGEQINKLLPPLTDLFTPLEITTEDQFKKEVLESKKPAVVMFGASWCSACRRANPKFEIFAQQTQEAYTIAHVDVDTLKTLSRETYGIKTIPAYFVFKDGNEVVMQTKSPLQSPSSHSSVEELKEWVDTLVASTMQPQ